MKLVSAACAKANLPELLDHDKTVSDLEPSIEDLKQSPKFGTGKGNVKIIDPHWADPMSAKELEAFLAGPY